MTAPGDDAAERPLAAAATASRTALSRRLFIVAGEPSGDIHAAHLIRELKSLDPGLEIRGFGGKRMQAAGLVCLADLPSRAIMGLFPVLAALPQIRQWFRLALRELVTGRPEALVLVDYPGFNLRLAVRARRLGIPVVYYISPQVWAWNKGRIRRIAEIVDLMLVILPFETQAYASTALDCRYVGHPLIDHLEKTPLDAGTLQRLRAPGGRPIVGLFPGSRKHVARALWPVFARTARRLVREPALEDARFLVAAADADLAAAFESSGALSGIAHEIVHGATREVMQAADLCLTTSGTTTLEIAAHEKPMIIAYRVSPVLWWLGRMLIRVPHIGLANLIAGREIVPEHVGVRSMDRALAADLADLWRDEPRRRRMAADLAAVHAALAAPGSYRRTAEHVTTFLASRR